VVVEQVVNAEGLVRRHYRQLLLSVPQVLIPPRARGPSQTGTVTQDF